MGHFRLFVVTVLALMSSFSLVRWLGNEAAGSFLYSLLMLVVLAIDAVVNALNRR